MSQSKLSSFYSTRKSSRIQSNKVGFESNNDDILSEEISDKLIDHELKKKVKNEIIKAKSQSDDRDALEIKIDECKTTKEKVQQKLVKKKATSTKTKTSSKKNSKASKSSDLASQTKVTNFYETTRKITETDNGIVSKTPDLSTCLEEPAETSQCDIPATVTERSAEKKEIDPDEIVKSKLTTEELRITINSPKRNLTSPNEGTPPKKKTLVTSETEVQTGYQSPSKCLKMTPKKLFTSSLSEVTSSTASASPEKSPIKVRSEEALKVIADLKQRLALKQSYESNPYKVTAVISPSEQCDKTSAIPAVPANERYKFLSSRTVDTTSFVLPVKYKVLAEMFRSMDTVVSILNNRKERITFEKVKEGVQKMMKRNFSKTHLGQIVTVMPTAYDIKLEKSTYKKAKDPDSQLVIYPVLEGIEGSNSKSKSKGNIAMAPQDLMNRRNIFNSHLLNIVKDHHKVFFSRLNFVTVPSEVMKRWHPKFQVDSVPDIEVAVLPEVPEVKVSTAKDVLNKILKGSSRNKAKVISALKCVSDETTPTNKKPETDSSTLELPSTKSALKGVCSDLLAKVRARESAKLLECMTETPDQIKRKAMRERLPKIVQILWHYFIAERKAAVPIDTAVEKIIHSCGSLSTHEEVKAHLTLITETFPGWLSFIEIPKGLYLTMDKNKNINEMLASF